MGPGTRCEALWTGVGTSTIPAASRGLWAVEVTPLLDRVIQVRTRGFYAAIRSVSSVRLGARTG